MKKIINISYLFLVSMLMLVASCTESYNYTPAEAAANQVYFDNTQSSTIEIIKDNGSFDVNVKRVNTNGTLTVPLTFTADEGNIYTVPSSVTFADGENNATIHVTYNPNDVEYGTYVGGTITVGGDGIDTTYGLSQYTFKAGATEWADIDENNSVGQYREDLLTTFFSVENEVYDIKIQKSVVNPGMYRLVNTYGKPYPNNTSSDYDGTKDYYWVVNATDPDYVYLETYASGMDWSYGEFSFTSYVSYYLDHGYTLDALKTKIPQYFGTLKDGIITMPAKSMLMSMADYQNGGWYIANKNGKFAIALPGYVIADYSVSATYEGRLTDTSDNDLALFNITLSADVAKIKYALVSSDQDQTEIYKGIVDGSVEAEELTESGTVQITYGESGTYSLIMVMYNAAGEVVGVEIEDYKLKSSKETAEVWNEVGTGVFTIGAEDKSTILASSAWGLCFGETMTQEGTLLQSSTNTNKFRIEPFISDNMPLEFTVDEDGTIVSEAETSVTTNDGALHVYDLLSLYGGASSTHGPTIISKGGKSYYDTETKTYNFVHAYVAGSGSDMSFYGIQLDKFVLGSNTSNAKTKVAKANRMKTTLKSAHHMQSYTMSKAQRFE